MPRIQKLENTRTEVLSAVVTQPSVHKHCHVFNYMLSPQYLCLFRGQKRHHDVCMQEREPEASWKWKSCITQQIPKLALNGKPGNWVLLLVKYALLHALQEAYSCTVQRSLGCWMIPLARKDALKCGASVMENTKGESALEQQSLETFLPFGLWVNNAALVERQEKSFWAGILKSFGCVMCGVLD